MMKDKSKASAVITAPSAAAVDLANTPSLIGYWELTTRVEIGVIVPDISGKGNHLLMGGADDIGWDHASGYVAGDTLSDQTQAGRDEKYNECWTEVPGWFAPRAAYGPYISLASLGLDGTEYIVMALETIPISNGDQDHGTMWCQQSGCPDYSPANYEGLNFGTSDANLLPRFFWVDTGTVYSCTPSISLTAELTGALPVGVSMGFRPSTDFTTCHRSSVTGLTTNVFTQSNLPSALNVPASYGSQGGYFSLTGKPLNPAGWAIRNVQLWAFATEPSNWRAALEFLSVNPGKIPPWWIGV